MQYVCNQTKDRSHMPMHMRFTELHGNMTLIFSFWHLTNLNVLCFKLKYYTLCTVYNFCIIFQVFWSQVCVKNRTEVKSLFTENFDICTSFCWCILDSSAMSDSWPNDSIESDLLNEALLQFAKPGKVPGAIMNQNQFHDWSGWSDCRVHLLWCF